MKRRERIDELRARHRELALERGIHPRDVDLLLADLLDRSTSWLFAHGEELVDPEPLELLLERRYSGEPLQYIRGRTEFYSREFLVDNRVLIPRPETELVVEAAIERAKPGARIIDLGTGSGCIAISIECERTDLRVTGVDASVDALAVAKLNRDRLDSRVTLAASDLFKAIRGIRRNVRFPLIPGHEPAGVVAAVGANVRNFREGDAVIIQPRRARPGAPQTGDSMPAPPPAQP